AALAYRVPKVVDVDLDTERGTVEKLHKLVEEVAPPRRSRRTSRTESAATKNDELAALSPRHPLRMKRRNFRHVLAVDHGLHVLGDAIDDPFDELFARGGGGEAGAFVGLVGDGGGSHVFREGGQSERGFE